MARTKQTLRKATHRTSFKARKQYPVHGPYQANLTQVHLVRKQFATKAACPLHDAIATSPCSLELTLAVLDSHPDAAKQKSGCGNYPLHDACASSSCPPEVVLAVLETYPDAAKCKSGKGNYPLHYACANSSCSPER